MSDNMDLPWIEYAERQEEPEWDELVRMPSLLTVRGSEGGVMVKWTVQEYSDRLSIQEVETGHEIAVVVRQGVNEKEWTEEFHCARLIAALPDIISGCERLIATLPDDLFEWIGDSISWSNVSAIRAARDSAQDVIDEVNG